MPKVTDTYALAYACCETVLRELKRFPTIDLIRERIGVNSPNTIKRAMNDWTDAFVRDYIEQDSSRFTCPEVPAVLTDAVYRLWQDAASEAQKIYSEKEAVWQERLSQFQYTLEQQQTTLLAADQTIAQAAIELESLNRRLAESNADNAVWQQANMEAQQREQALTRNLEDQKQQEIKLCEVHEQRRQQDQDWMQSRILEERELAANKWMEKFQHQEERFTLLRSSYDQVLLSQRSIQAHNQQLVLENTQLRAELAKAAPSPQLPSHRFRMNRKKFNS